MSRRKFKVNRELKKVKTRTAQINTDDLYTIYHENIKPLPFDDLVLIVLGGETGVICNYLLENHKLSGMIIIEPLQEYYSDKQVIENYLQITKNHPEIKYITVPHIEKNTKNLMNLLLKLDIFEHGLEVIINPFYEKEMPKKTLLEKNKLDNFLKNMKNITKGLDFNIIKKTKEKINFDGDKITKVLGNKKNESMKQIDNTNLDVGDGSLVIQIGGEEGILSENLLRNNIIHNLFIIEPLSEFSKEKNKQFSKGIKTTGNRMIDTFYFSEGEKEYIDFFESLKAKLTFIQKTKIIINPLYEKKHKLLIKQTLKTVMKYVKDTAFLKGNSTADDLYGLTNIMYNLSKSNKMKIFNDPPKFNTVISVAAGPSLDNHMEELKKLAKKFPVIAVDVIANKLAEEGIEPDIVCSQERTFLTFKVINNLLPEIKKKTIFVSPNLTHPFNLSVLENFIIFSQSQKSPLEAYTYKNFYNPSHDFPQSIYAGEVNLLTSLLFKPEEVLLFGHDLAITKEKKYASNVNVKPGYTISSQEIGNRGQTVFLDKIFEKFRNNTEVMLAKILNKREIKFLTFSDGAKVNHIQNATNEDMKRIEEQKSEKDDLKKFLSKAPFDDEVINQQLDTELETLNNQISFLNNLETFSDVTIMAKFVKLFIKNSTLSSGVARLMIDDFISNFMYTQNRMAQWIKEHKVEFLTLYNMIKGVTERTKKILNKELILPTPNSPNKDLFDFNFFSAIRDKAYDKKGEIKNNIEKDNLKYILLSFYYTFQKIDYLEMSLLLGQLESFIDQDEDAKKIYFEGIRREIDFYTFQWENVKDKKHPHKKIFRYQLASYHYKNGDIKWTIDFLEKYREEIGLPEKVILADALSDNNEFEKALEVYKDIFKENQSTRIVINTLHVLIMLDKIAEAYLFDKVYCKKIKNLEVYQNNTKMLNDKIKRVNKKPIEYTENINKMTLIDFKNSEIDERTKEEFLSLYSAIYNVKIYKNKLGSYFISKGEKIELCCQ